MAEEGTWENIRDHGLLSTSALLDRFEIGGAERVSIEEQNRRKGSIIAHPDHGTVVIRDQIPMTDGALKKCLQDMTLTAWYKMLNSRVFFWTTEERLLRLFNAEAYRGKTQCIIRIDTKQFLARYGDRVSLSPINSGSTIFNPQPRGTQTFLPMQAYPFEDWSKKRSKSKAIVEVTVDHSVPDIKDFVTSVVHMKNKKVVETIV